MWAVAAHTLQFWLRILRWASARTGLEDVEFGFQASPQARENLEGGTGDHEEAGVGLLVEAVSGHKSRNHSERRARPGPPPRRSRARRNRRMLSHEHVASGIQATCDLESDIVNENLQKGG